MSLAARIGGSSHIWGNPLEVESKPETILEIFKTNLSMFSEKSISQEECIKNCINGLDLQFADETSQVVIEAHLSNFSRVVHEDLSLTDERATLLESGFKEALGRVVEEKWAAVMAKAFYPIPSISNEKEQITAAQKWTDQFFTGVAWLNKWEQRLDTSGSVAKRQHTISTAFNEYSHEVIQNRMKTIFAQAEKDPLSFGKKIEEAIAKKEKDQTSLSALETEYAEYANNMASCLTMYWPDIERNTELLKKCIWYGYTLKQCSQQIVGSGSSCSLFGSIFKKT